MWTRVKRVVEGTWQLYVGEHGDLLAAGLAFYALLSAAPLVLLATMLSGVLVARDQTRQTLLMAVESMAGEDVASTTEELLLTTRALVDDTASIFAGVLLLWAASRFFVQMQVVLNVIWGVRVRSGRPKLTVVKRMAIKRTVSFFMVFGCGVMLLVAIALHGLLSATYSKLEGWGAKVGVDLPAIVAQDIVVWVVLMVLAFAAIYRVLPDARIPWRDVWAGAVFTTALVTAGTVALTLYLGRTHSSVTYGALGSLAAFTLWTYYLAQVFVVGCAFTRAWSGRSPGQIEAEDYAELVATVRRES